MRVRPLSDRILVRPVKREERTKAGIVLPDTAKEKPQEGIIEAIGPDPRRRDQGPDGGQGR